MAITLEFARFVGCGQLGILFKEDVYEPRYGHDAKVTFAFLFDRSWEQGEFLAKRLMEEVVKIFPDARLVRQVVEPRGEYPAYLVFSKTVCGELENPDGLLRLVIGKFEPILERAMELSGKDTDEAYEAELQAEAEYFRTGGYG